MKYTLIALFTLVLVSSNGCSRQSNSHRIITTQQGKFIVDKQKSILHINRTFELYKKYKAYKAMAIAMDQDGKYIIGYAKDAKSSSDAQAIALENCQKANMHAQLKVSTACTLYAIENVILNPLQ